MRKNIVPLALVILCPVLLAQQALSNDAVLKLVKAGLSDDLIVTTITASPGNYDTSADGLIALKSGGASEKVIAAIVLKSSGGAPAPSAQPPAGPNASGATQPQAAAQAPDNPRVFLASASKGKSKKAERDQSMEMSKDFEKSCTGVRITISKEMADYTVLLNHVEGGVSRDNQIQVADKRGDLISQTKEGGSIKGDVKKACALILSNWARTQSAKPL
ncbi:MAG TPA: hypothetical protein VG225_16785 [Terracidiphilus sp.]|jgi:hypothetical protein|nr:hypothetical protein [Terracidiphilus sp.]